MIRPTSLGVFVGLSLLLQPSFRYDRQLLLLVQVNFRIFFSEKKMNSSYFPVTDDFGHVMSSIFELVDIKFLVLYMLSFLTLIGFGLLFLFVVVTLILIEFFQNRYPAVIRFDWGLSIHS